MNLKLHPKLKNGYVLSLIGHLLLLLILAIFVIKPTLPTKWHSFEWELPDTPKLSATVASKGAIPGPITPIAEKQSVNQEEAVAQSSPPTEVKQQPRVLESPVIDASNSSATTNPPSIRTSRNRTSDALRSLGNTLPSGNFGFSSNLEQGDGDAYIIAQPKPVIVPDIDGEVFLEFKLNNKGGVDANSLIVLSYNSASYVEAVKKVLPQWRFGFRGAYNPDRKYRIRCKFIINEG
ncbi:MAG: hypothetical protein PHH43_05855 [Candidatus Cloacimonetes bacterium]|nr:hypothetical protein [Candidatus Cloacimonadota bacterium]MDD3235834.1 hypothetical protein [Candidatus Cloacimonadota bacterium]